MVHGADGERGERGRVEEEKKWRKGEAMGAPVSPFPLSPEEMCVFIFVCAIYWPSWALAQGRAHPDSARGVTLGVRHYPGA